MPSVIVIPARYASTRFPGKPLALIAGVSLIERVHRRSIASQRADAVWVATDDERIEAHVRSFGGNVVMTSPEHASGTDRIAAALREIERQETRQFTEVINVQGDEPLIDIAQVDRMIETLQNESVDMVTLGAPLDSEEEFLSRDVVKLVTALDGNALYFSRAPIPYGSFPEARRHVGVYGYTRDALYRFTSLERTPLEIAESLEQLRAMQNGFKIRVLPTKKSHLGVDRPEDVAKVERELALP